jgi:hypothetical protein
MSTSTYYHHQAQLLARLAIAFSTSDVVKTDRYKLAAIRHLERADTLGGSNDFSPAAHGSATEEGADRGLKERSE